MGEATDEAEKPLVSMRITEDNWNFAYEKNLSLSKIVANATEQLRQTGKIIKVDQGEVRKRNPTYNSCGITNVRISERDKKLLKAHKLSAGKAAKMLLERMREIQEASA